MNDSANTMDEVCSQRRKFKENETTSITQWQLIFFFIYDEIEMSR